MIKILLLLAFFLPLSPAAAEEAYAQLSSLKTQVPSSPKPMPIIMDSIDLIHNFDLSPKRDRLTAKVEGNYFVIASGQSGSVNKTSTGYIDLWFVKNSEPVANSNSRMSIDNAISISILVTQFLIRLSPGDTIGANFSASSPSLGFIFTQPDNEPANTSFLFSIFKID